MKILNRDFLSLLAASAALAFVGRADFYFYGVKPNLVLAAFSAFSADTGFWLKVPALALAVFILNFGFGETAEFLFFFSVMAAALFIGSRLPGKKILNVAAVSAAATFAVYGGAYYGGASFPSLRVFQEAFYNVVLAAMFYLILNYGKKTGT